MRSILFPSDMTLAAIFLCSPALMGADIQIRSDDNGIWPPIMNSYCPMSGNEITPANAHRVIVTIGEGAKTTRCCLAMCSEACVARLTSDLLIANKPRPGKEDQEPEKPIK